MEDANLQIELVGKRLVHYKLFKGNTKRTPISLSGKEVVEKYLKDNKAYLVATGAFQPVSSLASAVKVPSSVRR